MLNDKKIIVIKLSGTALETNNGLIDIAYLRRFGKFISTLVNFHNLAITVGGGEHARKYISVAKEFKQPDSKASLLGGDIGLIYCRILSACLKEAKVNTPPNPIENWDIAEDYLRNNTTPILYGRWPALTSDSVAVYFADYVSANLVLKLSCVDAIYDKDPNLYNEVTPIRNLTFSDLEQMSILCDSRIAGCHFVIDLLAAKRLKNSEIPLLFVHKDKLELILELLGESNLNKTKEGTFVGI